MREQQIAEVVEKSEVKNFEHADEIRTYPGARLELVKVGGVIVGRATLQPGWRWSESVRPTVETDLCEAGHFQYHVSGVLRIRMADGTEFDCHPGDVVLLAPSHEAWVVGDEPVVLVDFRGMSTYSQFE
jgi:hypothetical protein